MTDALADAVNALCFLHDPEAVFEICVIEPGKATSPLWEGRANGLVVGYFNDPEAAAKLVLEISEQVKAEGIYVTLNPCKDATLARANNRLKAGKIKRTADKDILTLKNLLIDFDADPGGVSGVSSTDAEHEAALEMAQIVQADLIKEGWPEPMRADSGNGAHLEFALNLPNTAENVSLLKTVLAALAFRYQDELARCNLGIDRSVFNPARLTKLYGTMVRKGDNTEARPHRLARVLSLPEKRQPVPLELLQKLAATIPKPEAKPKDTRTGEGQLDVEAYLAHYGKEVVAVKTHHGGHLYCLDKCIFNPDHAGNEAAIGQAADGKLFYQCFHSSCKGRTWAEARTIISGQDKLGQFMPGGGPRLARNTHASEYEQEQVGGVSREETIIKVEQALVSVKLDPETIAYVTNILKQKDKNKSLSDRVLDWAVVTKCDFTVTDCYIDLGVVTDSDKAAVRQALSRAAKNPDIPIVQCGNKWGCYRVLDWECEEIDYVNAPDGPGLNIKWPFGLENLVETYEKTVNIVAGSKNAGKTAWLLNFIRANSKDFHILYLSSELGAKQLNVRLKKFGYPLDSWKFKARARSSNFADVIEPDAINIIDYLEISDNFYTIGKLIREIYDKLRKGIAVIALQKDEGARLGRGRDFSMEKARLYVTLEKGRPYNKMEIIVGKNWASERNPEGIIYQFKLVQGAKIINMGEM